MAIQTIKGILVDGDDEPLANVIVEAQFSYGSSQVTGPGVPTRTNDDGSFVIEVDNDASGVDTIALTVYDQIAHTEEFDPEDDVVDVGSITVESASNARPRLRPVPGPKIVADEAARLAATVPVGSQIKQADTGEVFMRNSAVAEDDVNLSDVVPKSPKTAAIVMAPTDKMFLLQSDFTVTGLDPNYSDGEGRYTYRGELNGKPLFAHEGITSDPVDPVNDIAFSWTNDAGGKWRFYLGGILIWSSLDGVDYPWEIVNWDQENAFPGAPVCAEKREAKEITVEDLAAVIDGILNP